VAKQEAAKSKKVSGTRKQNAEQNANRENGDFFGI